MSYEKEDTCILYEEESACRRKDTAIHSCPPFFDSTSFSTLSLSISNKRIHAYHMRRRIHAYHMRRRIQSHHMRRRMRISLSILDKRRKGGEGRKEDWDTAFF
jgi:hypothetical protein